MHTVRRRHLGVKHTPQGCRRFHCMNWKQCKYRKISTHNTARPVSTWLPWLTPSIHVTQHELAQITYNALRGEGGKLRLMKRLAEDAKTHVWKSGRCRETQVSHICSKNTVTQSKWCLLTSLRTYKPMFSLTQEPFNETPTHASTHITHTRKNAYHLHTYKHTCKEACMHIRTHFIILSIMHAYHAHMQVRMSCKQACISLM